LATKHQQPGDIAIDSDVLPNPEQLPPWFNHRQWQICPKAGGI
jgi:hypothetical protein